MGLLLKPPKCRALSVQSGTPAIVDFHLTNESGNKVPISSVMVKPLKFLGSIVAEEKEVCPHRRKTANLIREHR